MWLSKIMAFDAKVYQNAYRREYMKDPVHKEAARQRQTKYRLSEKGKTHKKQYRIEHHAEILIAERSLYWREHDRYLEKGRKNNKATGTDRMRRWRNKYPDRANAVTQRYQSRKRGAQVSDLTASDWQSIQYEFDSKCVYCGGAEAITADHVIPLSRGGNHTYKNVVPACRPCNSKKKDKDLHDLPWVSDSTVRALLNRLSE